MQRLIATLGLAIIAIVGTMAGTSAQDATPAASPEASAAIPPVVWVSNDFTPIADVATPVEGAVAPKSEYWIQFLPDGQLSLRADCNGGFGSFTMDGSNLHFSAIGATLMLCPEGGSGDAFLQALNDVTAWSIDQSGASDTLVLTSADGSSISFSPSLTGVIWQWTVTQMSDDTEIVSSDPAKFYLSFSLDGSVVGQVDCNRAVGTYTTDGAQFSIKLATTLMYCGDNSQDSQYINDLDQVSSYVIRDGQLALALPMDGGIVFFEPVVQQ